MLGVGYETAMRWWPLGNAVEKSSPHMEAEARVLVVDDEHALRRLLRLYLEREGYAVVEAGNGLDALSALRTDGVDVALVDVMLPELDGFSLVRRIREESAMPIILVSARGEETNRVAGLELGADDYVVKPFSAPEVVARVRAQLRRARGLVGGRAPLRHRDVELDESARRVTVDGREVELTRREFDLLAALMREPTRVHTREGLLELVWGSPDYQPKTVDVHVASLRRKLGDAVQISALRGVGYRMES
jgi:DNA-binding response OmpR family regulator